MSILFLIMLLKRIRVFLFGERVKGEKVNSPMFFITHKPDCQIEYNDWMKDLSVGSRYGHRGSFYRAR
jgi:hypothetical protein